DPLVLVALAARAVEVGLEVVGADEILDVQERGPLLTDVDEGGLHARQNAADLAEIDVAEGAHRAQPLDMELGQDAVFDERYADFADVDVDDEKVPAHIGMSGAPARRSLGERRGQAAEKPSASFEAPVENLWGSSRG